MGVLFLNRLLGDFQQDRARSGPTAAGWQLQDGSIVPFNMTRQSPDGAFHVCRRGGQLTGAVIRPSNSPVCLWVPSSS